jgi:hypothetical protein
LPRLVSNHNLPNFSLMRSWDYRHVSPQSSLFKTYLETINVFAVLESETNASHVLSKYSTTELPSLHDILLNGAKRPVNEVIQSSIKNPNKCVILICIIIF